VKGCDATSVANGAIASFFRVYGGPRRADRGQPWCQPEERLHARGHAYVLDQWWVAAAPGAAIFLVSLAFNLLGDGLRDALDPKAVK